MGKCVICSKYLPSLPLRVPLAPRLQLGVSIIFHASFLSVSPWFSADSLRAVAPTFIERMPQACLTSHPQGTGLWKTSVEGSFHFGIEIREEQNHVFWVFHICVYMCEVNIHIYLFILFTNSSNTPILLGPCYAWCISEPHTPLTPPQSRKTLLASSVS